MRRGTAKQPPPNGDPSVEPDQVQAEARADLLGAVDAAHHALVAGVLDQFGGPFRGVVVAFARINEAYAAAEARGQRYAGTPDQIAASADLQRALAAIRATRAALVTLLTSLGVAADEADGLVHRYGVAVGDVGRAGDA